eukprot:NODE_395_length_9429_cov_0.550054.p4 type:complete len:377 gc:universal NODE_395_length_9429_cov_0.550054:7888-9018(+)
MTTIQSKIPNELVVQIFKDCPSRMFLLNKELTNVYLKSKYQNINLPGQVELFRNENNIFPYASYVKTLSVALSKLIPSCLRLNYGMFQNTTTLIIIDDHDKSLQYPIIVRRLPRLENIQIRSDLFADLSFILLRIDMAHSLKSLTISYFNPKLRCINKIPSLTDLTINYAYYLDYGYLRSPPLIHISKLVAKGYEQNIVEAIPSLFPNLEFFEIPYKQNMLRSNITFRFPDMKLKHLTCQGAFETPNKLDTLKCLNRDCYIQIPPIHYTFDKVEFYIDLNYHSFRKLNQCERLDACLEYCKSSKFEVVISFNGEFLFNNKFNPPFDEYCHTLVDGIHVFSKFCSESSYAIGTRKMQWIVGKVGHFLAEWRVLHHRW